MRTSERAIAVALLALASACHRSAPAQPAGPAAARASAAAIGKGAAAAGLACQPAGAPSLEPDCAIVREETARGLVLTFAKPDGGFRRLLVLPGGRGIVAADGAEPVHLRATGPAEVEVEVGGDRFRLPAKLPQR